LGTHTALLEATKSSVEAIAHQMNEGDDKCYKGDGVKQVGGPLNLFVEQVTCQTECDMHIYEQGQLVADNAHLATIKHGGVVSALDSIYSVLSLGMKVQS
jgi:hypothetical protein